MGFIETINQIITEHGSTVILKERLMLLRDHIEKLEKENQGLKANNAALKQEHDELKTQLDEQSKPDDFIEHRSMLFLRLPNGDIQDEVYCPKCKMPMFSLHPTLPFDCKPCGSRSSFKGSGLARIISEVTRIVQDKHKE